MARLVGVDIPDNKRAVVALTYIYGIGRTSSETILKEAGVGESVRVKDLSAEELRRQQVRRELLLEMERERAKAKERAARQRKELELELDPAVEP